MTEHLIWQLLHLTPPVTHEQARAALVGLAALPGQPRIVLETISQQGRIIWRIGVRPEQRQAVASALLTHLPGARIDSGTGQDFSFSGGDFGFQVSQPDDTSSDRTASAAQLRLPGRRPLPLRHELTGDVTRAVMAAFAATKRGEELRLQIVLGPRQRPRTVTDVDPIDRRAVKVAHAEFGFDCAIRMASVARTPNRAEHLVRSLGAALRPLEAPGVPITLARTRPAAVASATSPWFWPLSLRVSELVPLLGWPTAEPPLPGVASPHPRLLPPHPSTPRTGLVVGEAVTERHRRVALEPSAALRHLHVLGPSGVGKSTLLANLALQDIAAGHGVVVIDPKGDLVTDIARRVPADRLDDVVILDPTQDEVVGINGLGKAANGSGMAGGPDLSADVLLSIFHSLYADSWGPRTHDILHASLLTLARRGDASLAMVPLLLTNPGFRRSIVGRVAKADPMGLGAFWAWFDGISDAERSQVIAPLMNKLRPVLLRPGLRAVLGQRTPRFQLSEIFTQNTHGQQGSNNRGMGKILLVSLAKGSLGPEAARLLGSIAVALVWQEAQARVRVPASLRHRVSVIVDEVQDYLHISGPSDLADSLAQARGLGVSFTLAHQHLGQLPKPLRTAVLAGAQSRVAFALSRDDATAIATTTDGELHPDDFRRLPVFQAYAHLLTGGELLAPVSIRTRELGPPLRTMAAAQAQSRSRYARSLDTIEAELLALTGFGDETTPNANGADPAAAPAPRRSGRTRSRPSSTASSGDTASTTDTSADSAVGDTA